MLLIAAAMLRFAMKLVELNLFVWILYCSWDHYRDFLKTAVLSVLKVRATRILASQARLPSHITIMQIL